MIATLLCIGILASPPPTISVRVDGEGYLRFMREGRAVYAKEAKLVVRAGKLAHESGPGLIPVISVGDAPADISIDLQGKVSVDSREVGRIVLAMFADDIRPIESKGFLVAADRPQLVEPGEGEAGVIRIAGESKPTSTPPAKTDPPILKLEAIVPETVSGQVAPPTAEFLRAGGVQIVLNDVTEVDGDNFRLGQVATVYAKADLAHRLTAIEISRTPPFGVSRVIDRTVLLARMRAAGFDPSKYVIVGSGQAKVVRPGQKIEQAQFVAAAIAATTDKFGQNVTPQIKTPVSALVAPKGELTLTAERISQSGSVVTVVVAAFVDGKRINSRTIYLVAEPTKAKTVKVGDVVQVRVRSGAIVVETTGKVKSVDSLAGTVTVLTETGATKTGIVGNDGFIEVIA